MLRLLRFRPLAAALVLSAATALSAAPRATHLDPLSVGIEFASTSYIVGEPVPVRVLIRNNMSSEVILGAGERPAATVSVWRANDSVRRNLAFPGRGVVPAPLTLKPNEQCIFSFDLSRNANIYGEGRYNVTFGAIYGGRRYNTTVYSVEIVPGYVIAEGTQLFAKDPARQRHITVVRWPRDHVDCLFMRVRDTPDGRWFPTVKLGAFLNLMEPRLNIADNGEITTLHRATPEYYVRNVFWSLPNDFVQRSRLDLLDPSTADTARLNGLRGDLDSIVRKNEEMKEKARDER